MNFIFVPSTDIRNVWEKVKDGLKVVRERTNEKWLDEDVYCALKTNNAQLFMFDNGFCILQNIKDEWTNEPTLHIWITYHGTLDDVTDDFHSKLRELAHNIGSKRITFTSPRRWDRRSGAKIKSINYEIELK